MRKSIPIQPVCWPCSLPALAQEIPDDGIEPKMPEIRRYTVEVIIFQVRPGGLVR